MDLKKLGFYSQLTEELSKKISGYRDRLGNIYFRGIRSVQDYLTDLGLDKVRDDYSGLKVKAIQAMRAAGRRVSDAYSNLNDFYKFVKSRRSEYPLTTLGFEAVLIAMLLPFAVIWLWNAWQEAKANIEEDKETLLLTGELTEGMTKEGEITYGWR
ncbi:MAG: hypothetical protein GXO63_00740 [Candidatus Micrarchaeota archaeon]|nr:hypothetical protein [Candidatus Micrarchaeota archaeon]